MNSGPGSQVRADCTKLHAGEGGTFPSLRPMRRTTWSAIFGKETPHSCVSAANVRPDTRTDGRCRTPTSNIQYSQDAANKTACSRVAHGLCRVGSAAADHGKAPPPEYTIAHTGSVGSGANCAFDSRTTCEARLGRLLTRGLCRAVGPARREPGRKKAKLPHTAPLPAMAGASRGRALAKWRRMLAARSSIDDPFEPFPILHSEP